MPLNPASLQTALTAIASDPDAYASSEEENAPATAADMAKAWADAVEAYAAGILPISTTVTAAAAALESSLKTIFESQGDAGDLEDAFATFADTVGGGMAGAGYDATPPPALIGFAALEEGTLPNAAAVGSTVSGLVQAWMITGSAALIAPPNTFVLWS